VTELNLIALLAEVFECQRDDVDESARINETPGWNSLSHITLMMRLNDTGLPVPMTRIADLTTYEALAAFVTEAGGRVVR
jgi:acyl carrier protein